MRRIKDFINDERGQGLVEYGLILGLVAVAAVLALTGLGNDIKDMIVDLRSKL